MYGRQNSFNSYLTHSRLSFSSGSVSENLEGPGPIDVLILHDDSTHAQVSCRILALELLQHNVSAVFLSGDLDYDLDLIFGDDGENDSNRRGSEVTDLSFQVNEDSLSYAITQASTCLFFLTDQFKTNSDCLKLFGMVHLIKAGDVGSIIYVHETEVGYGGIQGPLALAFQTFLGFDYHKISSENASRSEYSDFTEDTSDTESLPPIDFNNETEEYREVLIGFINYSIPFNRKEPTRSYAISLILDHMGFSISELFFKHLLPSMKHFITRNTAIGNMGVMVINTSPDKAKEDLTLGRINGSGLSNSSRNFSRANGSNVSRNMRAYPGGKSLNSQIASNRMKKMSEMNKTGHRNRSAMSTGEIASSRPSGYIQSSLKRAGKTKPLVNQNSLQRQGSKNHQQASLKRTGSRNQNKVNQGSLKRTGSRNQNKVNQGSLKRTGSRNQNKVNQSSLKRTGSRNNIQKSLSRNETMQNSLNRKGSKNKKGSKTRSSVKRNNKSFIHMNESRLSDLSVNITRFAAARKSRISNYTRISEYQADMVQRRDEIRPENRYIKDLQTVVTPGDLFGENSKAFVIDKVSSWLKKGTSNIKHRNAEQVFVVTGPLGCGKTTLVSQIVNEVIRPKVLYDFQDYGAISPYRMNYFSSPNSFTGYETNALAIHYFDESMPESLSVHACFSSILFQLCEILGEVTEDFEEFYNYYDVQHNPEFIGTPEAIFKTTCELLDKATAFESLKNMKNNFVETSGSSISSGGNGNEIHGLCVFVIDGIDSLPEDELNCLLFIVGQWWPSIMPPWVRLIISMRPETFKTFDEYSKVRASDNFIQALSVDAIVTGKSVTNLNGNKKIISRPHLFYTDLHNILDTASAKFRASGKKSSEQYTRRWNNAYNTDGLIFVRVLVDLLVYADRTDQILAAVKKPILKGRNLTFTVKPLYSPSVTVSYSRDVSVETLQASCIKISTIINGGIEKAHNLKDLVNIWCEVLEVEVELSSSGYRNNFRYRETVGVLLASRSALPQTALEWVNHGTAVTPNLFAALCVLFRVVDNQGGVPLFVCMHPVVKEVLIQLNTDCLQYGHCALADWCVHVSLMDPYSTAETMVESAESMPTLFPRLQVKETERRFAYANYVYHLSNCGRNNEIVSALSQLKWISTAMSLNGRQLLKDIGDTLLGINKVHPGFSPDMMGKRVEYDLMKSAGMLKEPEILQFLNTMMQVLKSSITILSADPRELPSQLLLRLPMQNKRSGSNLHKYRNNLLEQAKLFKPNVTWLRPVYSSFPLLEEGSGEALWEVNMTARVNQIHVSADQKSVLVASSLQDVFLLSADRWHTGFAMRTLQAHEGEVKTVLFSPDPNDEIFISCSKEKIWKWDAVTGEPVVLDESIVGEKIICVNFSPDGKTLACLCVDKVILFDVKDVALIKSFRFDVIASSMAFNPFLSNTETKRENQGIWIGCKNGSLSHMGLDGSLENNIAQFGSNNGTIRCILPYRLKSKKSNIEQTLLALGTDENVIQLWDTAANAEIGVLRGHSDHVLDIADAMDIDSLVSCGWDRTIRVWDKRTYSATHVFTGHTGAITTLGCISNGDRTRIISGSTDGTIRMWLVDNDSPLPPTWTKSTESAHEETITCVAVSPDSSMIGTTAFDNQALIRDIYTGQVVRKLENNVGGGPGDKVSPIYCLVFSPNNKLLATGDDSGRVCLWDTKSGSLLGSYFHSKAVLSLSFSHDSKYIGSGSLDRTAQIWSFNEKSRRIKKISDLDNSNGAVFCLAFSAESTGLIATSTRENILPIKFWRSPREGQEFDNCPVGALAYTALENSSVKAIMFSGCGNYLVVAAEMGKKANQMHTFFIFHIIDKLTEGRTSNGSMRSLLASLDSPVQFEKVQRIYSKREGELQYFAMSMNNKVIVEVSAEKNTKYWDVITCRPVDTVKRDVQKLKFPTYYHSAIHMSLQAHPVSSLEYNCMSTGEVNSFTRRDVGFTYKPYHAKVQSAKLKSRNTAMKTFDGRHAFVKDGRSLHLLEIVEK